ncbi:LacI family transcriptional regulator [Friedmanniella endophytica]|uniref:LacI family transcriptional regulator n=1 Tax=Microlunatus kandeliicorticis TaxID=1759536 RepID=A0A7W3IS35_9ACTN|nr:LacI family DNA-binding transcriptional regulator [Microlunatus kandeliicorticis]MBA8794140.1 LacI family transcriptional regulator [Microlunatus kandeliicorticis]
MSTEPRASRPATIADVAARAGVSLATVSRVLNDNPRVDRALAAKVRQAADDLRYSASPLARSLVLGKTNTVAVVVPDLENPTFLGVLRGLSRAAGRDGYHILVADSAESVTEEIALAGTTRRRCDGLVLCAPRMPEDDLRRLLGELQPVVLVNREPGSTDPTGTPVVAADYRAALAELLELLHADGHRELVYLAGASRSASNTRRLAAVRDFGADHPDARVVTLPCGVNFADGYAAAATVADRIAGHVGAGDPEGGQPTAVLAFNDLVAMGLLSGLGERGIRVPADVSVTGFDDIPFARYLSPPLTTAAVPVDELGVQAWHRMADRLGGRTTPGHAVFRPSVERRASTGPAPVATSAGRTSRRRRVAR